MMGSDTLNWHDYGSYTEMTASSSNIYTTNKDESKSIIVHETLLGDSSTDVSESKRSIFNKNLSRNYSEDMDELCSTEKHISEYTITEQVDAEYEESSITKEVPSCFDVFECGRNILDRLDVTYERACMATPEDKYYTKLLKTLVGDNSRNGAQLSNEKLRQAFSKVMEEIEAEL